jgi:gliding motility-associated-like protein
MKYNTMKKFYLAFLFLLTAFIGAAQVITPFTIRYQATQKGGIRYVSNTATTCASSAACTNAKAEVPPAGTSSDNGFNAAYVDIDSDGTTFQSSSDSLALPTCSEISWAGLYWGGENTTGGTNYATRNQVKLKVNNNSYVSLTADDLQDNAVGFTTYHCFKDITSIVQAAGTNARYTCANVAARVGSTNRFGGWSIVVVYKNDLQPMRNLTVFNGLSNVSGANPITDITVSGFLTPLSGPVTFELGAITYDGDRASTGDQLMFNGGSGFVNISDAANSINDIFNSTYSYNGVQKTTPFINPGFTNSLGYDADIFLPDNVAKNYIGNSATSATLRLTTGGETFLTQVTTMAIDVYEPDLRSAVRVVDLNGGLVQPGDILEYTVVGKNIGSDPSVNTFITDTLERNAIYVPGSLQITSGPNLGAKTDAASDDQGEYVSATRTIKVRIGTGANGTTGGQVNNSTLGIDSTQFKYRVTATSDCAYLLCDNTINNRAYIFGTGNVSGNSWSNGSNPGIFDALGCPIPGTTATPINSSACISPTASSNSPVCTGSTINLSTIASTSATYSWTGPNGFTSSVQNPSITNATAAAAGTYTCVISIAGPSPACAYTLTTVVAVNATPATPSPSSNTPVCTGNTINLSTAAVAGATYSWTGPSSFASSLQNPTRAGATAAMAGTYSVTTTVNGCTSAVGTTAVVVNTTPATPAPSSNTPVCTGNTINLSTTAVAGATYSWTGPSAFSSSLQNPTRTSATLAMAGTYSVTVTVSGCTSVAGTAAVVVNSTPATPAPSSNTPICTGNTINLSTAAVAGATYSWTGPNSFSSSVQNPSITNATAAMAGTYSVTTTVAGCTSAAGTTAVVVNSTPPTPAPSGNSPVCTGNTINLSTAAVAGATYSWTGPNSFSSSVQNPSITNATTAMTGTYSVTVTANGCTSAVGTTAVVVNTTPATPSPSSNTPVCTGNTINLSTAAVAGATYSWTGPNSFSSSVQNPSIINATVAMAGTYSVTTTVAGCTSAAGTTAVVINASPVTPAPSSNSPVCTGNTINLSTTAVAGATYSWTGPNSFSSSVQNPSITNATATMAGTYSVTVTVAGCTSAAGTTAVVVNTTPSTPAPSSNSPVCTGNTINLSTTAVAGATYSWTGPSAFSSALQNPARVNATAAMAGTYSVTVTVAGCTSAAGTTAVVVNTTPATPSPSSNSPVCTGNTINLSTAAVAGATYSWTGPSSFSSSVQNPSITNATAAMAGSYSVTVTTSGCTSAAGTTAVMINTTPSTPAASSNSPVCPGSTINLSTPAVAGATYAWSGPNSFSSSVQNPGISSATAAMTGTYSVTVTVSGCTSTAGMAAVIITCPPVANDDNGATLTEDGASGTVNVIANDTDLDGNPAAPTNGAGQFSVDLDPSTAGIQTTYTDASGTWTYNPTTGDVTFDPANDYNGTATITYTLCDPSAACDNATITFSVSPVNDAPIANDDNGGTLTEDGANGTVNIISNDTDIDGNPTAPTNGPGQFAVDLDPSTAGIQTTYTDASGTWTYNTATGDVSFDPANDYNGTASITYQLCDAGGLCDNANITFSVTPVNDAPVANDDNGGSITEDNNGTISILTNDTDVDGNPTAPTNGVGQFSVDLDPSTAGIQTAYTDTTGTWTYDPATGVVTFDPVTNYTGTATVTYQLCDNGPQCDDAVITFSVSPANDAPLAGTVNVATAMNTPVGVNVGASCSDPENDPLTYTYTTTGLPSGTIVTVTGNGSIVVTPPAGYTGTITIPYTVCDQSIYPVTSLCDNDNIMINVADTSGAANAAPIANNDAAVTKPNTTVTVNPLANDFDVNGDGLIVTIPAGGMPANGVVVVNTDGTVTYTPNNGFTGNDTITYVICDNGTPSACDTADIVVTISPMLDQPNAAPIAVNDFTSTPEDTPVTIPVKNNDSDPNGGILGIPAIITNPAHGSAAVNADGTITYTPNNNYNGDDILTYVVCDNGSPSKCDTADVIVNVIPTNDAPSAGTVNAATSMNTPVGVNVGASCSDPENDPMTYTYNTTGLPPGTVVTVTGNGSIVVTPPGGYTGTITIPYTVCDHSIYPVNSLCDNDVIVINVVDTTGAPNAAPIANNDAAVTQPNTTVTVNPLANDFDVNGGGLTVTVPAGGMPTNGTITVNPNGTVTYTPNNGFIGNDTITYVICDNGTPSACDTANIVVTISPVLDQPNAAPIAVNDFTSTPEDMPVTVPVKNNDSDPNGGILGTPTIIDTPNNGTATVNPDGTITYVPDPDFHGPDTLTYIVCDNGAPSKCDTAEVIVNIVPVNDAPVITDVSTTVVAGTTVPVNVAAGASDPDGDALTYSYGTPTGVPVTVTVTGNGTIVVTPVNASDTGVVVIPVTVCDNGAPVLCDNGTITIHFVSDSTLANTNYPPQAVNDLASTNPNTPVVVNVKGNDTDPNGNGTIGIPSIINTPNNGTVIVNPDGTITYTPNNGFTGNDTLTYVVCDSGTPSLCDTAMVIVSVINGTIPNHPPVATDDYPTVNEGTPTVIPVKNNDSDPDGNSIGTPTIIDTPGHGTATVNPDGTITYTPNPGFTGNDTLTYVVCDNGAPAMCDTANVVINVIPVNHAPVITDVTTTVTAGTTVPVNVAAGTSDPDGDALTYSYGTPTGVPVVVTVTGNGTIVVTPVNPTDTGIVVIPVTVCDNGAPVLCDNGTITIHFVSDSTLANTNFPPQAVNDLTSTNPNTPVVVNVKGNDSDPNGNGSIGTPSIIGSPTNGTAVVNPDGTITYTPNNGFTGNDTLTYVICDNGTPSLCDTAMVVISVINGTIPNQPPVATDDYPSTNENTSVIIGVKNNDSDPDGNVLGTPTIIDTPGHGTATVNPDGTITYTPNPGFTGNDTLVYVICDSGTPALCDTATVVIDVIPVNHAPVITDVTTTVTAGTPVPVNVAAGTSDPDGDPLTYSYGIPTGIPVVVTVTGNGTIVVTPVNASDTGYVVIPVTVCDNGVPQLCDNGTITIHFVSDSTLANTNFPPQAVNDLTSTNPNTPVVINVKGNDSDPNGNGTIGLPAIIGNPTNGTAVVNADGTITYTPNSGFTGNDTLTYVICDSGTPSMCDTAMVVISVINGTIPNHPPVATDDYSSTSQNTPVIIGVKNNDSDPDGNVLGTPTIITNPANGSAVVNADGTITYTPNNGFTGSDTLVYVICDGGTPSMCDTATVVITVIPGTIVVTNENTGGLSGTPITGNVTGNDTPGGLTVGGIVTPPAHGTFTVTPAGGFTYTPDNGFSGYDTVIVTVCLGSNCMNDTIFITIYPHIGNETITVTAGSSTSGTISSNDQGTGLTYGTTPVSGPAHGTVTVNSDGSYTYTANNGYTGFDTVVVSVCDASVPPLCSTDTIFISITEGITTLTVPEGFSPNGDGINDVLVVNGIGNFPDNSMQIFNRWGNPIFEAEHYDNSSVVWTGNSTGDMIVGGTKAPEATYFYILVYKDAKGEEHKSVGYIYLNRDGQQ